ncbi:MAG: TetR/AcrR family transcriptional regulator [Microbacteriaceae bacterium]
MIDSTPASRRRPTRSETRDRVVAAAASVFSEKGYGGAALEDIAARVSLTKGAIYSSFGGKDQLFLEVLKLRTDQRIDAVTSSPRQDGAAIGAILEEFTAEDPVWHLAFIQFWASVTSGGGSQDAAGLAALRQTLRTEIAEKLVKAGRDPDDASRLAILILALSNGLAIETAIDPEHTNGLFAQALRALLG